MVKALPQILFALLVALFLVSLCHAATAKAESSTKVPTKTPPNYPHLSFTPPNVRHHPGFATVTPMIAKVSATGVMTWEAVDNYGWSGWRNVVSQSLDTDSSDALSLGRVLNEFLASENRGQITIREAQTGEKPDSQHFAVATAFVEAKCGSSWATACIYGGITLSVPAYYKAAAMVTWAYSSQAPVVRHETFHTIARACDQYEGGCPRVSDGRYAPAVRCTGNPDTLMDCGGAARTVTPFDYVTFRTAYPANTGFLQQTPEFFHRADGWSYHFATQVWWNPLGEPELHPCNADGLRWDAVLGVYLRQGTVLYNPRGYWLEVGGC